MSEQTHVEKLITFVMVDGRFRIQLWPAHTPINGKLYRLKVAIPQEVPQFVKTDSNILDMFLFACVCERLSTYRRSVEAMKDGLRIQQKPMGLQQTAGRYYQGAFDQFRQGMEQFGCSPASRGKIKAVPLKRDDPFSQYLTGSLSGPGGF